MVEADTIESERLEAQLGRWAQAAGGRARLINLSENHTFLIEGSASPCLLRLHRPGYQSPQSIASELAWIEAIRAQTALAVPQALAGRDGALLQRLDLGDEVERLAVLFTYFPGAEPQPDHPDMETIFAQLGRSAASLHLHVQHWERPHWFTRQAWTAASVLDADGLWGDWRRAPHVEGAVRTALERVDAALRQALEGYGMGSDRYGLIHADMRLANVLLHQGQMRIIDFDDSGLCWFLYDLAAALSFIETSPRVPALRSAWLAGYQAVRPLSVHDLGMVDAMIMLRRMALLAWIGTHLETGLAQAHAPRFAQDTAMLGTTLLAL